MDDFERAVGNDARFGLIYADYQTQERIRKNSACDYPENIRTNGANL